jgi:hypothetical protein
MIGWSWPDSTDLIDMLESSLQALQLEDILDTSASRQANINSITGLSPNLGSAPSPNNSTGISPNSAPLTPSTMFNEMGMGVMMRSRGNSHSNVNQHQVLDYSSYFPPLSPGLTSFAHLLNNGPPGHHQMTGSMGGTPTGSFDFDTLLSHSGFPTGTGQLLDYTTAINDNSHNSNVAMNGNGNGNGSHNNTTSSGWM